MEEDNKIVLSSWIGQRTSVRWVCRASKRATVLGEGRSAVAGHMDVDHRGEVGYPLLHC